ncbi:hypothetical protein [Paenibacillus sp. QZ-Y1]|uniref:hypothetical protein n=1 Tax=Paenibacillus sp. QZ-Y1 TaxID=3414511 RepID=UPI003F7AE28D
MKKICNTLFMLMLVVPILASCTPRTTSDSSSEHSVSTNSTETKTDQSFQKGVFIDWEKEYDPLLNDQIITILKRNLDATVSLDEPAFRSTFPDSQTADHYTEVAFGAECNFTEIFNISEDKTKHHILVNVLGNVRRDNTVEQSAITYYFAANGQGEWSLVALD